MAPKTRVKLCGVRRPQDVAAAAEGGVAYVGLMFYGPSPRNISYDDAGALALTVPLGLAKVAVVVNPTDAELDALTAKVPIDMIQLHGAEPPARVAEVKSRWGLPVMKAVGIADHSDLENITAHEAAADQILVEAKPPKDAALPGGNGLSFDHRLLSGFKFTKPWMLAGGLSVENAAEAIALTGARQIDLSSGVEREKGVKDPEMIKEFLNSVP